MRRSRGLVLALACGPALALLATLAGCHAARILAPPPPLRAASASDFAVDVEFAEPLARASAETAANYLVYPLGHPETPVAIFSATLIDTANGRVVQLLLSGGPLADSSLYEVRASDVRPYADGTTGVRTAAFHAGLGYGTDVRALMAIHCDRCHGPSQPGGQYRTDSYLALFGNGSDGSKSNLVAGDPNSLIIKRTRPLRTMYDQGAMSYLDFEILYNWIVSYDARL